MKLKGEFHAVSPDGDRTFTIAGSDLELLDGFPLIVTILEIDMDMWQIVYIAPISVGIIRRG